MALYTLLLKVSEDEHRIRYRFGPDAENMEIVESDFEAEVVREVQWPQGVDLDTDLADARKALARSWARGEGFSDVTSHQVWSRWNVPRSRP